MSTLTKIPRVAWLAVLLGLALTWAFLPTLGSLANSWTTQAQYSHGYVVPLFSLYLLWAFRNKLKVAEGIAQPRWGGLFLLGAGLLLHFAGTALYFDWFSQMALLPCLAGLSVLIGGWRTLAWSGPAILFLAFMIPLPFSLETALAHPLQRIATIASTFVLQLLGFAAFAQGNIIHLGEFPIAVVEACNGLSMLVVFFALATAVIILVPASLLEKIIILLSAIPIALISNITRITVTAILYQISTAELAHIFFHDVAGWLMMLFALGLLWVEFRLLSWIFIAVPVRESSMMKTFGFAQSPGLPTGKNGEKSAEKSTVEPSLTKP